MFAASLEWEAGHVRAFLYVLSTVLPFITDLNGTDVNGMKMLWSQYVFKSLVSSRLGA